MMEVLHFSPAICHRYREAGDRLLLGPLREADNLFREVGATAVSNNWHLQSPWKRALAVLVYGDLLAGGPTRRIREVGGGLSGITVGLARTHDYSLVELATHEGEKDYRAVEDRIGRRFVTVGDWDQLPAPDAQDVVIANDLFPNVDQRLEAFLARYLPTTREMRLTLTYYENTVWQVRRVSSGETLTVKPWGLREVTGTLDRLAGEFGPYDRSQLVYEDYEGKLFTNRRNILWVRLVRDGHGNEGERVR
jgi:hypothetical protein